MSKEDGSELAQLWPMQLATGSRSIDILYEIANRKLSMAKKEIKYILLLFETPRSQSELSELCATNQANTARAINSLVDKGLVERAGQIDGRSYSVKLSAKGVDLCNAMLNELISIMVHNFNDISEDEYQAAIKVLKSIHNAI